jgi:hypothetical protein
MSVTAQKNVDLKVNCCESINVTIPELLGEYRRTDRRMDGRDLIGAPSMVD